MYKFLEMKTIKLLAGLILIHFSIDAQISVGQEGMTTKSYNFTSFTPNETVINDELVSLTPVQFQSHPEFGMRPFNSQCDECSELIEKRTLKERYYIKNGTRGNTFFVQAGLEDLHFKDSANRMITIDPRLKPHPSQPNVYHSPDQPLPTGYLGISGSSTIRLPEFILHFNKCSKVVYIHNNSENILYTSPSFSNTTVGDDGAYNSGIYPGINRSMLFERGSVKSNFIINTIPALNNNDGWLGFEDRIELPSGYKIKKAPSGGLTPEGFWQGDLILVKETDNTELARWHEVSVYDNAQNNIHETTYGAYQLIQNGTEYIIRTLVKIDWLKSPSRVMPVTVDPLVSGTNTWTAGQIGFTPYTAGNGFCGSSSTYCLGGPLNVTFPGAATITNVLWSNQYIAVAPTLLSHGGFRMVGPCGENPTLTNNWWNCNIANSGTCTGTNLQAANLATCVPASCNPTVLPFRTKNIHCINPVAGNCNTARLYIVNNSWVVTVQGQNLSTLSNTTTGNGTTTIAGTCFGTVTLNPNPMYSVLPYTYLWSPGGSTAPTLTFSPNAIGNNTFLCTVTDACGVSRTATFVVTNNCVLPIELSEFYLHYNGSSCELNWTTLSEKNTAYFLIEKSQNGIQFETLGSIKAAGNSTQKQKYIYADLHPEKNGLTYYKLSMFEIGDSDPKFSTMEVLSTSNNPGLEKLRLQPNPANHNISLFLPSFLLNRSVTVKIFSGSGQCVYTENIIRQVSSMAFEINTDELKEGLYSVFVYDEKGNHSKTNFIKN